MTQIQRKVLIMLIEALITEKLNKVYGLPKTDIAENAKAMFHSAFEDDQEKSKGDV